MNILVSVVAVVILLGVSFGAQPKENALRYWYWLGLSFKIVMGVSVGLLYTYYYQSGDTFSFFDDSVCVASLARTDFTTYLHFLWTSDFPTSAQPLLAHDMRSLFFIKWISAFNLLSGDNYWITGFYFSLISFLGAWRLFLLVKSFSEEATITAAFSLLFFPSFIFWTSGMIKESLAMGCLLFATSHVVKMYTNQSISLVEWLVAMLSLWVAWKLKYYFVAVFVPTAFALLVTQFFNKQIKAKSNWVTVAFFLSTFMVVLVGVSFLHPNFHFGYLLEVMVANNEAYDRISDSENLIHYYHLSAQPLHVLANAPWALVSGLFRPFLSEAHSILYVVAGIEDGLLLILFCTCFMQRSFTWKLWKGALIVYVVLLCIFLAISVPNMGTLSRYRVGFLPFFVFIISYRNPLLTRVLKIIQKIK